MNKEYIYKDGEVIIIDDKKNENENQTPIKYYDNLDKVLVTENVIEEIEKEIKKLEEQTSNFKSDNKLLPWTPLLIAIITPTIAVPLAYYGIEDEIVHSVFGTMKKSEFLTIFAQLYLLFPFSSISVMLGASSNNRNKVNNGRLAQLKYLKEALERQTKTLEELKKDLTNTKTDNSFKHVTVDDKEMLYALKRWLEAYYDMGYNEKKYYKYFKAGKLEQKVADSYNKYGLEALKDYLEEKYKTLSKNKNK